MSYKTILAILDTVHNATAVADFAFAIAAQTNAHVIGLHAETVAVVPLVAPMEIPDPVAVQALQDMAHSETVEIERIFRRKAEVEGVSFEWRSFASSTGYGTAPLIESARSADLLIASQADPSKPSDSHVDVDNFLFESGRPVLMIPFVLRQPKPIKRVLIAWNGSKEAARAAFDALPILQAADEVEVFSVDPVDNALQSAAVAGAEIAANLARHGVKVTLATAQSADKSASAVIENRLSDSSIDLLVMGAYTHSRLWQMIFGGTTKSLLQSMTALTLLSR
ncbi:nucleotide-binding universal stress UspA family protein [Rhizobium tibeticum]|uniref:Nucleotide-binding universal stress protein, UspA family n=1 Tax=Rhizobium tibeticum TaxID=501024 RepID=A0A1H8V7U5_9HYPH|nr:universal stress protein [Rhizobium tibeticum]MDP9813651.1 nucleotide-binding universal stress UspA family protein [Rhizobium tibeticum]SEI18606.1 Universal stress protein family protein [Rhizobium tibeticum]SEP11542.1 Nucleotide-binding universal stress protein, UspA family [Rhizobium tibeticum]